MTARDDLLQLHMDNRAQTSTRDTTGAAMAEAATEIAIARYGSAKAALEFLTTSKRQTGGNCDDLQRI